MKRVERHDRSVFWSKFPMKEVKNEIVNFSKYCKMFPQFRNKKKFRDDSDFDLYRLMLNCMENFLSHSVHAKFWSKIGYMSFP